MKISLKDENFKALYVPYNNMIFDKEKGEFIYVHTVINFPFAGSGSYTLGPRKK